MPRSCFIEVNESNYNPKWQAELKSALHAAACNSAFMARQDGQPQAF